MKTIRMLPLLLAATGLAGCSLWPHEVTNPGNPNLNPYAGEPGSTYDVAANPPRDIGQVAYMPAPPSDLKADILPPPAGTVTAQPLRPLPGTPVR